MIYEEDIPNNTIIEIKTNILNFYQKLCCEILSRIDISDKQLNCLKYFDPLFIKSNEEINYFEIISQLSYVINDKEQFID